MTISPFPPQITRREVLDAAKSYAPVSKPEHSTTALVWVGAVLILAGVGTVLSVLLKLW